MLLMHKFDMNFVFHFYILSLTSWIWTNPSIERLKFESPSRWNSYEGFNLEHCLGYRSSTCFVLHPQLSEKYLKNLSACPGCGYRAFMMNLCVLHERIGNLQEMLRNSKNPWGDLTVKNVGILSHKEQRSRSKLDASCVVFAAAHCKHGYY